MATSKSARSRVPRRLRPDLTAEQLAALKARCKELGYRLVIEEGTGAQFVFGGEELDYRLVYIHQARDDDLIEDWLAGIEGGRPAVRGPKRRGNDDTAASPRETNIEHALRAIDRTDRLLEICKTSVQALDVEHSGAVARTMGTELWEALDEARKALKGGAA